MKKIIAFLLALTMALTLFACGKSKDPAGSDGKVPDGAVTDETKLGESVTYSMDGEDLLLRIKTSADFDAKRARIAIVNPGVYVTRNSESITRCLFDESCFDESFDREWFEGEYVYRIDSRLTDIASDDEWAPGLWTMMLYEDETGLVIGEWLFAAEGGGKYHFEFRDSWLNGAGEAKKAEEFDSLQDEAASWFTFNEYNDEWAEFLFDGYYLEETDPQGYDKYYLMVCPEGDYATYDEAMEAHVGDYSAISERCPYKFSIYHSGVGTGEYTVVLARNGGQVEVQFGAEKLNETEWKLRFDNAKCPALEGKYAE